MNKRILFIVNLIYKNQVVIENSNKILIITNIYLNNDVEINEINQRFAFEHNFKKLNNTLLSNLK